MTYDKKQILNMLANAPIDSSHFCEDDNDNLISYLQEIGVNDFFNYNNGATKFVLIPKDEDKDYVIKLPYTGSRGTDYYYKDTSSGNCYRSYISEYYDYTGSESMERPWDYCATETKRYEMIEKTDLKECFAKTELIGFIDNYPIYVQEKCATRSSLVSYHSAEENKTTMSLCGNYYYIDENWLTDFRLYYGLKKMLSFIRFLRSHEWDDDLRNDNIGYIGERPVLIDYSGFWD